MSKIKKNIPKVVFEETKNILLPSKKFATTLKLTSESIVTIIERSSKIPSDGLKNFQNTTKTFRSGFIFAETATALIDVPIKALDLIETIIKEPNTTKKYYPLFLKNSDEEMSPSLIKNDKIINKSIAFFIAVIFFIGISLAFLKYLSKNNIIKISDKFLSFINYFAPSDLIVVKNFNMFFISLKIYRLYKKRKDITGDFENLEKSINIQKFIAHFLQFLSNCLSLIAEGIIAIANNFVSKTIKEKYFCLIVLILSVCNLQIYIIKSIILSVAKHQKNYLYHLKNSPSS